MVTDQLFLPKHNGRLKQSLSGYYADVYIKYIAQIVRLWFLFPTVTSVSSENSELTSLEQVGNDKSVMGE